MKKYLLLLLGLISLTAAEAAISIKSGSKYRFECVNYSAGQMVLGANHNVAPYVYYDITANGTYSDDAWWIIERSDEGYTIRNAKSGEYLIYKEGRETNSNGEYVAKGIQLSETTTSNAYWSFTENNQGYIIVENIGTQGQYFNVRTDGTYLVGTYQNASSANGFFLLYDEDGNSATTDGGDSGGGGGDSESGTMTFEGESGTTTSGEYWERTGLSMPVVVTTDTSNPVYYRIVNVRSGQSLYAYNGMLQQSTTTSSKFYFVQSGEYLNIYASDGSYVSTDYEWRYANSTALRMTSGTASSGSNIWSISFGDMSNVGYSVEKQDNLSSDNWNQSEYAYWNDYSLSSGHAVGLYDLDEGGTFVFLSSDERHKTYLISQGVSFDGTQPSGSFTSYVDSVRLGGKDLIFDTRDKVYYATIPQTLETGDDYATTLKVTWTSAATDCSLKIGNDVADADGNITLHEVSGASPLTMAVVQNGTDQLATAKLYLTFMPIVEMTCASCNSSSYTKGTIRVTCADNTDYDSTFVAGFKYRGASAQNYSKKSYAVKLYDASGEDIDREFFGLRNDNNWILDAMYIDNAAMRNRVSTDLWNDFAKKPYQRRAGWEPKAKAGTRGRFVEVFLNGRYYGIYCMTEKMDRKQLRLKKYVAGETTSTGYGMGMGQQTSADTVHGTLYKTTSWGYEVFMGHNSDSQSYPKSSPSSYNNNSRSESWCYYELKYPDWETEKIDWAPIYNAVNFVCTSEDDEFDDGVKEWFDYPVLRDYYLFIELMLATDNHGKNMFFFNYDQKGDSLAKMIGIAPWDMDGTWGQRWDGSKSITTADQDFTQFLIQHEHGTHTLFYRLANSTKWDWTEDLKERYAKLRTKEFAEDALVSRFTTYRDLFVKSNADAREKTKWGAYHKDISGDVDYIQTWIHSRLTYLDEQYGYDPTTDITQGVTAAPTFFSAEGGKGTITIHATDETHVNVYGLNGALVRSVNISQPITTLQGFPAGVYIVGQKKVVVR